MLTHGEDVEINALRKRGWSYVAIGRHIGRDWRTVKAYLETERQPGVRRPSAPDALESFVPYLTARFADDAHVWASTLYEEVKDVGYTGSSYVKGVQGFSRGFSPFGQVRRVREGAQPARAKRCWAA